MSPKVAVAILDDYQHVAFSSADWSPIRDRLDITVFDETVHDEGELVKRLEKFEIVCAMRERTKFPGSLLDKLPRLKLIATTGMVNRGIDTAHAQAKGIAVSGTGAGRGSHSTQEHIWALLLATVRYIPQDDANTKAGKPRWQHHIPLSLSGHTLGLIGVGRLGSGTAKVTSIYATKTSLADEQVR